MSRLSRLCLVFLVAFVLSGFGHYVSAQDFRIENKISFGNKTIDNLTIFKGGIVYDFIKLNGEITILDKKNEEIKILEPTLRIQTSLTLADLKQQVDELHTSFQVSSNPFLNFIARPVFDESAYEPESGLMVFRSLWLDYEFTTKVFDDDEIAREYYDSSLWFSRLNVRVSPAAVSALVRAGLNQTLEQNKRFPEKVTVKLYPKGKNVLSSTTIQADSTHVISKRLSESDNALIAQAQQYMQSFLALPFEKYQQEVHKK